MKAASVEAVRRAPFANYDIVVYFGAALFSVPFLNRYIFDPLDADWPSFSVAVGSPIARETVSILTLLFCVYMVGHIIAFVSSHIVEKFFDRILGKVSTAILLSALAKSEKRNEVIRSLIYNRVSNIGKEGAVFTTTVRTIIHIPAFPIYALAFSFGIFGYYDTRIPPLVLDWLRQDSELRARSLAISLKTPWYKPLEYLVINQNPNAVPRMYNYLVISGLFRSLSLIFLASAWAVIIHAVYMQVTGEWKLQSFLGVTQGRTGLAEWAFMITLYAFSISSYLKFQRRYAEEVIFAFVFRQTAAD